MIYTYLKTKDINLKMLSNKLFAHRGLSSLFPENTLLSFEHAVLKGYQCIECDILLTKDMIPIVCHDENLKKLTGIDLNLIDITFNDFKKLKIYQKNKMPTEPCSLNELLSWKKKHPFLKINLELKSQQGILPKELLNILKNFDLGPDTIVLSSFNQNISIECLKIFPEYQFSFLSHQFTDAEEIFCLNHGISSINLDVQHITIELITKLVTSNISLGLFTINDWSTINYYLSQKIQRIFTDHP